jgi:hypothetical protein
MKTLALIALGFTGKADHPDRLGELRVTAQVESHTEMAVTESAGIFIAEARCLHAPGCDGEPVLAWSRGPALFAFDGERIEVSGSPGSLLAGVP